MVRPGHFVGKDFSVYDQVYKVEDIPKLALDLSKQSGAQVQIGRSNKSSNTLTPDDLHPKTKDMLRNFMNQEYEHLGAFYDNPLT